MLAVDHDCTELTGGDNLVLERQLADAGAGRGVQTVEHAGVLDGFGAVMHDHQVFAGPV